MPPLIPLFHHSVLPIQAGESPPDYSLPVPDTDGRFRTATPLAGPETLWHRPPLLWRGSRTAFCDVTTPDSYHLVV